MALFSEAVSRSLQKGEQGGREKKKAGREGGVSTTGSVSCLFLGARAPVLRWEGIRNLQEKGGTVEGSCDSFETLLLCR